MRAVTPTAAQAKQLAALRHAQATPLRPVMVLPQPPGWDGMNHEAQCALWEHHAGPQQAALMEASHEDTRDRT